MDRWKLSLPARQRNRGATLIEAMLAGVVLAGLAALTLPTHFYTSKVAKRMEFQEICQRAVKGKLAQYRSGRAYDLSATYLTNGSSTTPYTSAAGRISSSLSYRLAMLSDTTQLAGADGTGFYLAKYIYNTRSTTTYRDCTPDSEKGRGTGTYEPVFPPSGSPGSGNSWERNLGTEEAVGAISSAGDSAAVVGPQPYCTKPWGYCSSASGLCSCKEDTEIQNQLGPGFRIFVNIQRVKAVGTVGDSDQQGDCPSEGATFLGSTLLEHANHYDFDGYGDAIRVTATGIYDSGTSGARPSLAGVGGTSSAISQMNCSASEVFSPPNFPVRYVLGTYTPPSDTVAEALNWPNAAYCSSGKCRGAIMTATGQPVFMALWNSNNKGLVVAPNNRAVYILKSTGEVYKYGNETRNPKVGLTCVGAPADCTTDGSHLPANALTPSLIAKIPGANAVSIVFTPMTSTADPDGYTFEPSKIMISQSTQSGFRVYSYDATGSGSYASDISNSLTPLSNACVIGSNAMCPAGCVDNTSFSGCPYSSSAGLIYSLNGKAAYMLKNECSPNDDTAAYCVRLYKFEETASLEQATPLMSLPYGTRSVSP